MTVLSFYNSNDPNSGFLSNFYHSNFVLEGDLWPTVEHYYQARKFNDAVYAECIRNAATPKAAKTLAQTSDIALRPDWEQIKQAIMLRAVAAKFCLAAEWPNELTQRLINTAPLQLVESSPTDAYWGAGADGNGANHLGCILMAVRSVLLRYAPEKHSGLAVFQFVLSEARLPEL